MKKQMLKSALIALAGVGLMSGSASAIQFVDINNFDDVIISTESQTGFLNSYEFTFDLDTNPLLSTGTPATAVTIGATDWISNAKLYIDTGFYGDLTNSSYKFQLDLGTETTVTTTISGYLTSFLVTSLLNPDHELKVTVTAITGEHAFTLQQGILTGTASPVPEPATMLLFGTGVAGLAGIVRRKK
jgi:hypothetical protein